MTVHNTEQFEAWNGDEGQVWAAGGPGGRDVEDPDAELTRRLLDAALVGGRDRVLDIGCGTGDTTLMAASRAPEGHALGLDLSGPMLDEARKAASGRGNVTFEQGDAQVHPLPDGGFDVAVSRHGVMFFADPVAAFANVRRALRPGGRLAFICPQPPEFCAWYVVPVAALLGMPPEPPEGVVAAYPGPAPAMFSLSERDRVGDVLGRAGLTQVSIEAIHVPHHFGATAADAADAFLASGPTRYIVEQDDTLTEDEARRRLRAALAPYEGRDGVLLPGAQWLVTAGR